MFVLAILSLTFFGHIYKCLQEFWILLINCQALLFFKKKFSSILQQNNLYSELQNILYIPW